jgi:hypothetical protein
VRARRSSTTHNLPIGKRAELLGTSDGSVDCRPGQAPAVDLAIMRRLDRPHLEFPFRAALLARRGAEPAQPPCSGLAVVDPDGGDVPLFYNAGRRLGALRQAGDCTPIGVRSPPTMVLSVRSPKADTR